MTLPVDVAILTAQEIPSKWVHLANSSEGPIFSCGNCYLQRYTLVSKDLSKLPSVCPKCLTAKRFVQ